MPAFGSCHSCKERFSIRSVLKRQRCSDCREAYCSRCGVDQLASSRSPSSQLVKCCMLCRMYRVGPITANRQYLSGLPVRDLKDYLAFVGISTDGCVQKSDLVELISCAPNVRTGCRPSLSNSRLSSSIASSRPAQRATPAASTSRGQPVPRPDIQAHHPATPSPSPPLLDGDYVFVEHPEPAAARQAFQSNNQPPTRLASNATPTSHQSSSTSEQARAEHEDVRQPSSSYPPRNAPDMDRNQEASRPRSFSRPSPEPPRAQRVGGHRVDLSKLQAEDIRNLSVLQLKETLAVNFIDFRGCLEKKELIELMMRLWLEKHPLPGQADAGSFTLEETRDVATEECRICMDEVVNCVLLECGHMCCCVSCGRQLAECPICRRYVSRVVHVFRS